MSDEEEGELLPPENDDSGYKPETYKPNFSGGRRTRERSLKVRGKEKEEEVSERAMLIEIMGKDARVSRVLEIFDKARHREGERAIDLQGSQRSYLYAMMAREEKQAAFIEALMTKNLEQLNQMGELIIAKANASTTSKITEVVEVIGAIAQIPIMAELQAMMMESLADWKKRKALERERAEKEEKNKKP